PPQVVLTPGVVGSERTPLLVVGLVAHQVLAPGVRQVVNGAFQPEAGQLPRLTGPRPETGTPKQPLGLCFSELPSPDGHTRPGNRTPPPRNAYRQRSRPT